MKSIIKVEVIILGFVLLAGQLLAKDPKAEIENTDKKKFKYIVMGGGRVPQNNQLSIELNTIYFLKSLERLEYGKPETLLFSDGNDKGLDIQVSTANDNLPDVKKWLPQVLGSNNHFRYRSNQVPGVDAPSTRNEMKKAIEKMLENPSRENLIAGFAHGYPGPRNAPYNTAFTTYNERPLRVQDLAKYLDKQNIDQSVVLFMTQCYSGGFADFIFKDGKAENGLSDKPRCGIFSTLHSQPSTGCTPNVEIPGYTDFGSMFWSAMTGVDQKGKPFEKPDYDNNGKTTMLEAMTYTFIHANTIDVPLLTSDRFLDHFVGTKDTNQMKKWLEEANYTELFSQANELQKIIIKELMKQNGVNEKGLVINLYKQIEHYNNELKMYKSQSTLVLNQYRIKLQNIKNRLIVKWPSIENRWDIENVSVLKNESDEIMKFIKNHPAFKGVLKFEKQWLDLNKKDLDKQYERARPERLLHMCKRLVLEKKLKDKNDPKLIKQFEKLVALEANSLIGSGINKTKSVLGKK